MVDEFSIILVFHIIYILYEYEVDFLLLCLYIYEYYIYNGYEVDFLLLCYIIDIRLTMK